MMDKKVRELLNQQINKELYSAYLYLDFLFFFEERGLNGFANWYFIQAQEERDHAMLFYRYLINNNETLIMQTIVDSICFDFASVYGSGITEIYTPAIESITKCIIDGTTFSISDKRKFEDYCTTNFQ